MHKPRIDIIEINGDVDTQEYETFAEAKRVFCKLVGLLIDDTYGRTIRLIDQWQTTRAEFDSNGGKD